jgi:tricorn protease
MRASSFFKSTLIGSILLAAASNAQAANGYLRYPDLHGNQVVFCTEGDLWISSVDGGESRRLTTHPGAEYFPHFSPDGKSIAFTAQYDGNFDVYVVPAEGGGPKRLTWHPSVDEVTGWTPDGKEILFRSGRAHAHGNWMMYAIAPNGSEPRLLPLDRASRLAIDPDTGMYAFTITDRERATWKRYRGGTSQDIWVGNPKKADFKKVTDFPGPDAFPSWHDGRIFFLSDEGGTGNIWSMMPDGSDRRRLTDANDWDIRWPNMAPDGRIVYMLEGDIYLFDPETKRDSRLPIAVASENVLTRRRYPKPEEYITWFDLSPKGDRVAIVTRGEIFSVPVKKGITLPISGGSGARESWASFDSESKKLIYVSDVSREEAIYSIDAWGRGEAKVLKRPGETGWHFPPLPSPDGKWIAYADQTQTLFVMPAAGGTPRKVDRSDQAEIRQYSWSPDGRYLAYRKFPRTEFSSIWIFDTKSNEKHAVTTGTTNDYEPTWDPDGRYLYFLSDRTLNPVLDNRDFQNVELQSSKPYLVVLQKDGKNPFAKTEGAPPSDSKDEKEKKKEKDKKAKKDDDKDKDEKEKTEPVRIDFDGLTERVVEVPVDAGIYWGLQATDSHLYFVQNPVRGLADDEGEDEGGAGGTLKMFDIEEEEEKDFAEGVTAFDLEAKAEKIAFQKKKGNIYVVKTGSAPEDKDLDDAKLSLEDVVIELDPREEWEQIYYEAWRHMRDFYWNAQMSDVDWKDVRDRYATLLPRIATREELGDVLGEVIGELATSHTYRWGGDSGVKPTTVATGLLGADVKREGDHFKVVRIYRGDPADLDRSPLSEPGVNVREGDYLIAINHRPFAKDLPFEANFEGLADKEVLLTVNTKGSAGGAKDVVVTPLTSESRLRYIDWVRGRREYVAEKTGGKIGYVHLPNMGTQGLVEFNRWFYPQLDKEGMIVDCRYNGGGFVSQMILERFRRKVVSFDRSRGGGIYSYPYRTLNGPFVVVTNEQAGSDGDIFPYAVQMEKLAPVIGTRSWGGVVGIRDDKRLVDGGHLTQPEYAWWDPVRGWAMENQGVTPDIEVANLPQDAAKGIDTQMDRAIKEVLMLHAQNPPIKAAFGPEPPKSRAAFREREMGSR